MLIRRGITVIKQTRANAGERGACYKYSTLDTDGICNLPVASIADDDCALFMWATFPMLPDALRVMSAWGFEYKTVAFVWVKKNRKANSDFFGMGNWTRANAEVVLLGTRGRIKRVSASIRQVCYAPIMRHSEKPAIIRERIVELMGNLSRIELFARTKADGWDVFGNEVESDIEFQKVLAE